MPAVSAAVVGAGISGLAAAHALLAAGADDCVVLEAAAAPGGVIGTRRAGAFLFEQGPDSFLTAKPAALALCRELGLGERLLGSLDSERKTWIRRRGRLMELPAGWQFLAPSRLGPALATPLLSAGGKLRMAREWWAAAEPYLADESVASLVRRRFGAEVLAAIVAPLIAGVYGGDAAELSAAAVLPRLLSMARRGSIGRALWRERRGTSPAPGSSAFTTLRGGLGELIAVLAGRLGTARLRLRCRVEAVEPSTDGGYRLRCQSGETITARTAILALPAPAAAALLEGVNGALAADLAAIAYAPSVTVNLAYEAAPPLPAGTGTLVAEGEGLRLLACTFMHRKFAERAPAGAGLLRLFYGGRRDADAPALDDAALLALARREVGDLFGFEANPCATHIARWPAALPQPAVGHCEGLERIAAALASLPGLALAGNAYGGLGIADCIASGRRAATSVLAALPHE